MLPFAVSNPTARGPLSAAVLANISEEFPRFRIVWKAGDHLSRCIDVLLRAVTIGGQRSYMTRYHTVIGHTLYVPSSWSSMSDVDCAILLRHERVHLQQRRRLSFAGMAFIYLIPWFPLGLAYGRARLEWEAYVETLRATAELKGAAAARSPALRAHIIGRFVGPDYGWMWPFPRALARWYDAALSQIEPTDTTGRPEVRQASNNHP